jgi:hypothetical protein
MGARHLEDILFIRDSRNQMVFLHHRPEGDFYGFQFECQWDGEICYLFCETSKSWFESKHPNEDAKQLIELHKDALADRAFEKHTQGDSRLHPSQKTTTLRRYDVALDEEDWAVIESL